MTKLQNKRQRNKKQKLQNKEKKNDQVYIGTSVQAPET
jgi:hypothetical protein